MTRAQAKTLMKWAMQARAKQEPPTQEQTSFVLYYTHPLQHRGIGYAAQRGPGWWAEELERIVAAYQSRKTPEQVEAERQGEAP